MQLADELYLLLGRIFPPGSLPRRLYSFVLHSKQDRLLRCLIGGRRVLVVGSGLSAKGVTNIPSDMLVFACNLSPKYLPLENGKRHVDLYILNRKACYAYGKSVDELLPTLDVDVLVTRNLAYMKTKRHFFWRRFVRDRFSGKSDYGYRKLTGKNLPDALKASTDRGTPSTGMTLILLALLYGAKEVYILGIDLAGAQTSISNWEIHRDGKHPHKPIDEEIIRHIARNTENVFVASQDSPLAGQIPHKSLQG